VQLEGDYQHFGEMHSSILRVKYEASGSSETLVIAYTTYVLITQKTTI
jgi:hypothetical protein